MSLFGLLMVIIWLFIIPWIMPDASYMRAAVEFDFFFICMFVLSFIKTKEHLK